LQDQNANPERVSRFLASAVTQLTLPHVRAPLEFLFAISASVEETGSVGCGKWTTFEVGIIAWRFFSRHSLNMTRLELTDRMAKLDLVDETICKHAKED
jgi:hypothetical protein